MSLLVSSSVSHSYGYGLLDAAAIVAQAKNWTNVGPQQKCVISMVSEPRLVFHSKQHANKDPQ